MIQEQEQKVTTTLTSEQREQVTKIQDDMIADITHSTKAVVRTACELMESLAVPKQEICFLICERAQEWEFSEGYLRRLVPDEYKNQAQRDIRLTHEGEPKGSPAQITKTLEVNGEDDIQPINVESSIPTPKKNTSLTQKYKSELDKLRIENILFRNRSGITFVYECLRDEVPELELGKKVKDYFLKNKWYLKWLKSERKHEASLNVKGKTREDAYLDNLNKLVDVEEQKEKQKTETKVKTKVKKIK